MNTKRDEETIEWQYERGHEENKEEEDTSEDKMEGDSVKRIEERDTWRKGS